MQRRDFVKLSATLTIFAPYYSKAMGLATHSYQNPMPLDIKTMSILAFERFKEVWHFEDFWKRGNTFDACLNFADALYHKFPDDEQVKVIQQEIAGMLSVNLKYFNQIDPNGMWADDFGWWGLLGLNARRHLLRLGNTALADKYLDLSVNLCWRQEKEHAFDATNTAKPVPHGCTNSAANGQSNGVKNTVTNVLFFLLSTRNFLLSVAENRKDGTAFAEMAYAQWKWFDSWFELKQYGYLKKVGSGAALVQERPTAFFKGSDYQDKTHPTWEPDWIWSGDQGMMLAALSNMLAMKEHLADWIQKNNIENHFDLSVFEGKVRNYIHLISKGVKVGLTEKTDLIIMEAPFEANFGPEFGRDYLAGRGILMRYLGELPNHISSVDYKKNILLTVEAIWKTRNLTNNQFQSAYTSAEQDKSYIEQFRKMTGVGDDLNEWQIGTMEEKQKSAVCQSIGLDAMGAYLRMNT